MEAYIEKFLLKLKGLIHLQETLSEYNENDQPFRCKFWTHGYKQFSLAEQNACTIKQNELAIVR